MDPVDVVIHRWIVVHGILFLEVFVNDDVWVEYLVDVVLLRVPFQHRFYRTVPNVLWVLVDLRWSVVFIVGVRVDWEYREVPLPLPDLSLLLREGEYGS